MAKQLTLSKILEEGGFKLSYKGPICGDTVKSYFEEMEQGKYRGVIVLPVNTRWLKGYAIYIKPVKTS